MVVIASCVSPRALFFQFLRVVPDASDGLRCLEPLPTTVSNISVQGTLHILRLEEDAEIIVRDGAFRFLLYMQDFLIMN